MPYSSFYQPVDKRSRAAMTQFLGTHGRYGNDFCCKVKITALNIPDHLEMIALAATEIPESYWRVQELMREFEAAHRNTRVGFEGRSGGYITLSAYALPTIHDAPELEALDFQELRSYVYLVQDFDYLADDCVAAFMDFAINNADLLLLQSEE